jgi:hypothetical protein
MSNNSIKLSNITSETSGLSIAHTGATVGFINSNTSASFTGKLLELNTTKASATDFSFLNLSANSVAKLVVRGDGLITASGGLASSSTTTGTMIITGGLGVSGDTYSNNLYGITSILTNSLQERTGSSGITIPSRVLITNATTSTTSSTGATVISGGLGVAENINSAGFIKTFSTSASSSSTTGALIVSGGAGIALDLFVGGSVRTPSDARLKRIVSRPTGYLKHINKLSVIKYINEYDVNDEKQIGVIAQELNENFPELVKMGEDGFYSVDYSRLTAVLIQSIKDLVKLNGLKIE